MKRYGEERSKMPRVGMGKKITSLFQTASVLKGKFFFNKDYLISAFTVVCSENHMKTHKYTVGKIQRFLVLK
jgi:hypothetical protein